MRRTPPWHLASIAVPPSPRTRNVGWLLCRLAAPTLDVADADADTAEGTDPEAHIHCMVTNRPSDKTTSRDEMTRRPQYDEATTIQGDEVATIRGDVATRRKRCEATR
ncbi:hypothetical protein BJ912DRAFT_1145826 [Pholiota molesta]|nr:hypothetical protein BJ912DRAFT_1145826 [Pholiota molesta]